ncbi:MAG: hypothetical protein SFU25_12070 [Candidatus Caenarcaniphilales bacterium]|nr:hypothetical protein [Candidatus Caenarcaniphilales bacterium]
MMIPESVVSDLEKRKIISADGFFVTTFDHESGPQLVSLIFPIHEKPDEMLQIVMTVEDVFVLISAVAGVSQKIHNENITRYKAQMGIIDMVKEPQ